MAESGHIKNIENLDKAIAFATGWGPTYTPSNPMLSVAAMGALRDAAAGTMDEVQTKRTPYRNATAGCEDKFSSLSKLTTRIMRSMKAQGIAESVIEDANTYARKIKGRRATPVQEDDPATPEVNEATQSHSASQMSRAQRVENFNSLRSLLEAQVLYAPNENELKNPSLKDYADDLEANMGAVNSTFVPYSNSLASRDDVLYLNDQNVVRTGQLFKAYVEAAFGRDSTEWSQVRGLKFRTVNR